ncbi:nuclear transport factor 2 family protein [Aquihabitans sp. G128]|uniref:limonene-1,2-epoxide hydrolase family protein n=1 Tax=Aquihabitans sp. G128 TaxID=2849779 RepID=UPI001C21A26B|nr:limonene-1,2-epoxide hydrolase family protein [Aquihabitans sp. G128]QXC59858.1 nuclear transport factor 2 family protein [Aquihabitans sp. G128]
MPTGLLPVAAPTGAAAPTEPQAVAEAFLAHLAASDLPAALDLLATDVDYVNVGLPTIRGRKAVGKALGGLSGPKFGFEVYLHAISADGGTVLTERTDVIIAGPLRAQFWVWGRFDVVDGQITLWRDSFDFVDVLRGVVRGVVGIALPGLRPKAPAGLDVAPGR